MPYNNNNNGPNSKKLNIVAANYNPTSLANTAIYIGISPVQVQILFFHF